MSYRKRRLRIGIVGCGAIGGGIARYILKGLKKDCQLTGLYDIEYGRVERLRRELSAGPIGKSSLQALLKSCDLMIEAVNANSTREMVREALLQKRNVIAMSVGKLLDAQDLFALARQRGCHLLILRRDRRHRRRQIRQPRAYPRDQPDHPKTVKWLYQYSLLVSQGHQSCRHQERNGPF